MSTPIQQTHAGHLTEAIMRAIRDHLKGPDPDVMHYNRVYDKVLRILNTQPVLRVRI